ncbi:hypothetical protein KKC32_04260 [Patescibacteria group bacterium]|nr:hypothetical protein [Patescibacteria group bacterium]
MNEQQQYPAAPVLPPKRFPVLLAVLITIFLTTGLVGGGIFWWMSRETAATIEQFSADIKRMQAEKEDMERTINDSKKNLEEKDALLTELQKPVPPKISYSGDPSEQEKSMIQTKLINYYLDYYGEEIGTNDPVIFIQIKKNPITINKTETANYQILAAHKEQTAEFVFEPAGDPPVFADWHPDCFYTDCRDVPEKFKAKYPKLVESAMATK